MKTLFTIAFTAITLSAAFAAHAAHPAQDPRSEIFVECNDAKTLFIVKKLENKEYGVLTITKNPRSRQYREMTGIELHPLAKAARDQCQNSHRKTQY